MTRVTAIALLCFTLASCTRHEIVPYDPEIKKLITIEGKSYPIEHLLYDIREFEYPDRDVVVVKEDGIIIRVMADGALITADLPLRYLGSEISLTSRNSSPGLNSLYYTFYISVDQSAGEYGRRYVRILSWDTSANPYGGRFSITESDTPGKYIFDWEVTHKSDGTVISKGNIESVFERIPEVPVP